MTELVTSRTRSRRRGALRAAILILGASSILWTLFPPRATWVERWYSRGLYPRLGAALVPFSDFFPVSLGAGLIVLLPAAGLILLLADARRARRRGIPLVRRSALWLEAAAASAFFLHVWFIAAWGAGYRREGLDERLGIEGGPIRAEGISLWIAGLSRTIERDLPGPGPRPAAEALRALGDSLGALIEEWDGRAAVLPRRVKRLPSGALLSFGTSGMILPFFLEAHVDGAEPEVAFLATAAHELAHVGGLCGEADADLAAAIAGLRASHPYARYAVALRLFAQFAWSLPAADRDRAFASLPAAAREDLRIIDEARRRFQVEGLARVQRRVYDSYLRSQGLEEGLKEYSRVVGLLVRAAEKGIIQVP